MVRSEERTRAAVDIIVPIYNARDKLVWCVESVVRHARGAYRLILVNDASPDADMRPYLDSLASQHSPILVLHAPVNGGFVKSVNLGLAARIPGHDVLLLNSDTIVTPEFLELLHDCTYADETTGIVTPFSNNATICSLPKFCEDNPAPPREELDNYARCISEHSLRKRPEIVTGVGFAMYVRSAVLDRVGILDEAFGRGFGEENDYCERAKAAGYRVRLCDDVFIAHLGKASFGAQGFDFEKQNAAILRARWPHYFRDVAEFCSLDPVREVRQNAIYHLRRRKHTDAGAALQIVHFDPFRPTAGGTEFYVLDLVRELQQPRALIAYRTPDAVMVAEIYDGEIGAPVLHRYPVTSAWHHHIYEDEQISGILADVLDSFGVTLVHIHHLFGWPIDLWKLLDERNIPYHYTVHDYYCVCTNQNMLDFERLAPCACVPGSEQAERCQAAYVRTHQKDREQLLRIDEHRQAFAPLLTGAESILPPSVKAGALVTGAYAGSPLAVHVVPHGRAAEADPFPVRAEQHQPLRIGFIGCINHPSKGAAVYLNILRTLADRQYEWHFFGDMKEFGFERKVQELKLKGKVVFHGFYRREEIVSKLRRAGIDCVVMAPPWDETFSYTLSEALCAGAPVFALRRGALTERLETAGLGDCLFERWEDLAAALRERPARMQDWQQRARAYRHRTVSEAVCDVRRCYGPSLSASVTLSVEQQARTFQAYFAHECKVNPWQEPSARRPSPLVDLEDGYPAFWMPTYRAVRHALPRPARTAVASRVLTKSSEWRREYSSAELAKTWYPTAGMEVSVRGPAVRIVADTGDPYIVLPEACTQADRIDYLQVRLRTEEPTPANLQLYWMNEPDQGFSEERSLSFTMEQTADWQEYVIDLRRAWSWGTRPGIRHLRLDPLDHSGIFWLDRLSFGAWKEWQRQRLEKAALR